MSMGTNVYMAIIGLLILIIHRGALLITFPNRFKLRYTIGILLIALVLTNQFRNMTGDIIQWNSLSTFFNCILMCWLLKGSFSRIFFAFYFQYILTISLLYLTEALMGVFISPGSGGFMSLLFIIMIILYTVFVVLAVKYGRELFKRLFEYGRTSDWLLYASGAVYSFIFLTVSRDFPGSTMQYIMSILFVIWSFAVFCFAIINAHERTKQRYESQHREQKLSEEKALLESLNQTKAEFFGNISHEMKTPLTIIATDIQLAEQFMDEGKGDSAKELMREAWQETMQTANLVTDALTFTRGQEVARPMEPFHFSGVIETTLAVFEPLVKKQGNILKGDIGKTKQINGNADMLASALVNLLSNANRHTNNGIIKVQWAMDTEHYRLIVRDNGSGISPEMLPHVFERGVTDGSGTGLGLAIVKKIMELHRGEVIIESETGKGTSVTLIFPVSKASVPLGEESI